MIVLALLLAGGCGTPAGPSAGAPTSPASTPPPASSPAAQQPTGSPAPELPGGLLSAFRAEGNRLIFEFGGAKAPEVQAKWVTEVREDPSDRLVTLQGKAFLWIVIDGATLDTSPRESDPARAHKYTGPLRITPGLPLIKEVVVAGDFENVLSFGAGLDRRAGYRIEKLTQPARIIIEFSP